MIALNGANGFIGKNVSRYLKKLNYEVSEVPRPDYGIAPQADIVINCAWIKSPDIHDLAHLDFAMDTIRYYEECSRKGIRVINIGSHSEYGVQEKPASEMDKCEPVNTYGLAKLMVTLHAKKLGYNTLRLFAVYGDGGRTVKDVMGSREARFSQPENVKDFVPVGMVCAGIERLIHAKHLYGEVINICSGTQESVREMVMELVPPDEIDRELRIKELYEKFYQYPQRQYEPSEYRGDPTKMIRLLNIKP